MHRSRKTALILLILLASVAAAACGTEDGEGPNYQPISRQTATAQANLYIDTHTRGMAASALFLDGSTLAHEGLESIKGDSGGFGTVCYTDPNTGNDICEEPIPEAPPSLDMTDDAGELVQWFADNVFSDARITLEEDTRIVYALDPVIFCQYDSFATPIAGEPPPNVDSECLASFQNHALQVELRSLPGDTLVATLLIDNARPLSVTLSTASVAVEVDIAGVKAAAQALSGDLGSSMFGIFEDVTTAQGRIKVQMDRLGDQHYKATASITQAIHIAANLDGLDISFKLAASSVSLDMDGAARVLKMASKVGALDLVMPFAFGELDSLDPAPTTPAEPTVIAIHVGGASASATFTGEQDALTLSGISLGDTTSTVKINGQNVLTLDLNPDMGRAFDLTLRGIAAATDNFVTATVTPGLHIKLLLAMQNAASLFDNGEIPAWGRNETLELRLDGAPAPTVQFANGFEIVEGRLSFSATSLPAPIVIEAGQCVGGLISEDTISTPTDPIDGAPIQEEPTNGDSHPFSSLSSVACGGKDTVPTPAP